MQIKTVLLLKIVQVESYAGLQSFNTPIDWENLFNIFDI
jgi:hypothetical protein